ncbi:MAG: DNA recombination protein RmuC [Candidatus Paceibacterota bacterium]|jgi:DNA recombination protein RmuC
MGPTLSIIVLVVLAIAIVAIILVLKKFTPNKPQDNSLVLIQNQINEITRMLDSRLSESTRMLSSQFGESAKIIKDVTEKLTKLDETNKQVVDFADQLKSLQDILKNPKQRGILGEYYLETVLKNVLPPGTYQMQYGFKDGSIVDAVVFIKDQIIPVDSKFSLENYNRILEAINQEDREKLEEVFKNDLKTRIDETSKYIKPSEGTMDFAFMFIPSEAIYYDLLVNKIGAIKANTRDLIEYASSKKVIVVSPTSFLAYLQTVLQGLKALKIEESAKEIIKRVGDLGRHLLAVDDHMKKLGANLNTTCNSYNKTYKELGKIDKDVLKISGEAAGVEPILLEQTKEEDEEQIDKTLNI